MVLALLYRTAGISDSQFFDVVDAQITTLLLTGPCNCNYCKYLCAFPDACLFQAALFRGEAHCKVCNSVAQVGFKRDPRQEIFGYNVAAWQRKSSKSFLVLSL